MIAVVIVDYDSERLSRRCIDSVIVLGRDDLRFIVVDNGASVDAAGLEADIPGLEVLSPGRNLGFAGGCNLGLARALEEDAGYCLLLNPDTRAETDFIAPLLAAMEADSRIAIAAPTILEDDESRRVTNGGGVVNWWAGSAKGVTGRRLQAAGSFVEVPFATGAALLLRMDAFRAVGPMDEEYFLYFEESDYCQLLRRAGWKIAYLPDAEILHATSSIAGAKSDLYLYYFARNRIRFMRRCARWYHLPVFVLFNSLVRLPAMLALYGVVRLRPRAAMAIFFGFIDGVRGVIGPMPGQID